jgi:hypothetical protein
MDVLLGLESVDVDASFSELPECINLNLRNVLMEEEKNQNARAVENLESKNIIFYYLIK